MITRSLLILMLVLGTAFIVRGLWPNSSPEPELVKGEEAESSEVNNNTDSEVPFDIASGNHAESPNKSYPPTQTQNTEVVDSSSSQARNDEPYLRPHPDDSPRKFAELKALYVGSRDLNDTLKLAKPAEPGKFPWVTDQGVFKLTDGKLASWRRNFRRGEGTTMAPDSCFSLRLPGRAPRVGQISQGSVEILQLPDPYCFITVLHGTYYLVDLIEVKVARSEQRIDNPGLFYLYQKLPSGRIEFLGEQVRLSVTGQPNSDSFEMSTLEYCEKLPEPVADVR